MCVCVRSVCVRARTCVQAFMSSCHSRKVKIRGPIFESPVYESRAWIHCKAKQRTGRSFPLHSFTVGVSDLVQLFLRSSCCEPQSSEGVMGCKNFLLLSHCGLPPFIQPLCFLPLILLPPRNLYPTASFAFNL